MLCSLFVVSLLLVHHREVETKNAGSYGPVLPKYLARVIGGVDAKEGAVPYLVAVLNKGRALCSGSIVDDRWILTAAHCVVSASTSDSPSTRQTLTVRAGTNVLSKGGKHYAVDRVKPFEGYRHGKLDSGDIALLRLNTSLAYGRGIQKIKLSKEIVPINATVTVAGWGYVGRNNQLANEAQIIKLQNIDLKRCRKMHTGDVNSTLIPEGMNLCTFSTYGKGVCDGDSGGPVVWNEKQVAVVNWSSKRCAVGYPDVHASVLFFNDWIQKAMKANADMN